MGGDGKNPNNMTPGMTSNLNQKLGKKWDLKLDFYKKKADEEDEKGSHYTEQLEKGAIFKEAKNNQTLD